MIVLDNIPYVTDPDVLPIDGTVLMAVWYSPVGFVNTPTGVEHPAIVTYRVILIFAQAGSGSAFLYNGEDEDATIVNLPSGWAVVPFQSMNW